VLDHGADRDVARRGRRLRSGELRPLDGDARHGSNELAVDHDDEAQDDGISIAPPRRRMDEDRWSDDIANNAIDDLDGVLGRPELEDPRLGPVGPGELEPIAIEPHDEDLGLDRAVDVPTGGCTAHPAIVAIGAQIMSGLDRSIRRLDDVTNRAIAHARLRNSRLVGPKLATPEEVVGWFGAVQSQDAPGALWGLAQRMASDDRPTLKTAASVMDAGRIVRVHALRPTWHFLVPSELRWIQALTSSRVHRVAATMYRRLGLGADEFRRAEAAMIAALRGGRAMTRDELAAAVQPTGIDLTDSLVITHLAMHAELEAVICNGPRRGKQSSYMLVDERVPPVSSLTTADALRELTIRYFASHGPALVHDMAWWSGLTVGSVREGIALAGPALDARRVEGKEYVAAVGGFDPEHGRQPEPHLLLLPNYDEYLGSYSDYTPIFDASLPRPRNVGDVLGSHLVIRDGLVVGGWRRALARDRVIVTATLLMPLDAADLEALGAAAAEFGTFVGLPVELRVARQ
jgi:hypothetical protein